jgi:homoserine dehydrogenase
MLAAERPGTGPQVLVLTGPAAQGTVDLVVHALQAHPAVADAVTTLRVEALAG